MISGLIPKLNATLPWLSVSMISTFLPCVLSAPAILVAMVVFKTPPLLLLIAIIIAVHLLL